MNFRKGRTMRVGSKRMILALVAMTVVWLIGVAFAATGNTRSSTAALSDSSEKTVRGDVVLPISGIPVFALARAQAAAQAGAQQKPQMAEDVFKNIQVLKGTTVDDFMGTMGLMAASLAFCCSDCHTGAGTDTVKWEEDTSPNKRMARRMVTMVTAINKDTFGGRQVVTCWTCHRGRDRPVITPRLDAVYSTPEVEEDDIQTSAKGVPTVDQVLNKYIDAIGGAQRVGAITSYIVKGASVGFGGFGGGGQVEVFAKAPNQRATYIHFPDDPGRGDDTRTFNGTTGWIATPHAVLRQYELTGGELDGARLDAQLSFPGQIKQVLTNLRVAAPTYIEDRVMQVVQGNGLKGVVGTLYFDSQSGLLTRTVRFAPSPIGRIPTQVDYADYRDVGGIKVPYKWTFSWLDGKSTVEVMNVQFNVPIDAAKFGKPDPFAK